MANLDTLKASGMDIDSLPEDQQAALGNLDQSEIDTLVAIREKLNGEDEVGGFALATARAMDGNLVW